jgi:hypothetical protein
LDNIPDDTHISYKQKHLFKKTKIIPISLINKSISSKKGKKKWQNNSCNTYLFRKAYYFIYTDLVLASAMPRKRSAIAMGHENQE